jgi:hypothetical protein
MSVYQCACLFTVNDADEFEDHLLEAFSPMNDIGTDGQVHAEFAVPKLTCVCGFAAGELSDFDAHLLAVFATVNGVGVDGVKHTTSLPAGKR